MTILSSASSVVATKLFEAGRTEMESFGARGAPPGEVPDSPSEDAAEPPRPDLEVAIGARIASDVEVTVGDQRTATVLPRQANEAAMIVVDDLRSAAQSCTTRVLTPMLARATAA
ncbi:MAG TPA: hypothetical protein VL899_00630 [Alphaproteobacteria bacterium]|nr:hypothetical protein [Alphaproteobacteria bacterium]